MKRWLFNLATCVSLLLFAATIFLWVRGHRRMDVLTREAVRSGAWARQTSLSSTIGQINFIRSGVDGASFSWSYGLVGGENGWWLTTRHASWHAFNKYAFAHFGFAWGIDSHTYGAVREFSWFISIPNWFLAIVFAVMPTYWLASRASARRRYRIAHNLCVKCGYDLRASPQRCPECGTIVNAGIA